MVIDPNEDKRLDLVSAIEYLEGHWHYVEHFLDKKVREEDKIFVLRKLLRSYPVEFAQIIKVNFELTEEQKINLILNKISKPGNITLLIGAKRHGKTATSLWIAEQLHKMGIKILMFGFSESIAKYYPWIKQTLDLVGEPNSVLIYDEALLTLRGSRSMSKEVQERIDMIPTVGHRDMALIFLSQSFSVAPEIIRQTDYFWFKPIPGTNFEFAKERVSLSSVLKWFLPYHKWENLVYDLHDDLLYFFNNPLPSKWNDELSKTYSKIKSPEMAARYFNMLIDAGFSEREAERLLKVRGWDVTDIAEYI